MIPDGPAAAEDMGPDADLWLPVGPAVMLRGRADGNPRMAGRVRDLAVSPDGQRAYAASSQGGVWYTDTAGARWEAVGAWARVVNRSELQPSSNTLACGAVHVRFGVGAAEDEVWVATGEPGAPFDTGMGAKYAGVGVLYAEGPVQASRADPLADPWTRQAQPLPGPLANPPYVGLRGAGSYRLVADPADGQSLVAATTRGLHHHAPGSGPEPWRLVIVQAWETLRPGASGTARVTDVAWTPAAGTNPARLWVAVVDGDTPDLTDVWVSENGVAGPFHPVRLPPQAVRKGAPPVSRLGLATHANFPDLVYVLGSGPRLWRIDGFELVPGPVGGTATVATVDPLPLQIFGEENQSAYDLAVAIDPGNPKRVIVGGAGAESPDGVSRAAALYRLTLGGNAPAYKTDYVTATGTASPCWVGAGIHADVHRIVWESGGAHVWICCDGGIFRSTANADRGTFVSRATGLAVTEAGFVACHPTSDGVVLAGTQDNGPQLRIGESVWTRVLTPGDGGGVAFDPGAPARFVAQGIRSFWMDQAETLVDPAYRGKGTNHAYLAEKNASSFYSNAAVCRRPDGVTQLAVGTHRVWYTEQWGDSHWDGKAGFFRRKWVTLPSLTDPRAGGSVRKTKQDVLPDGWLWNPGDPGPSSGVRALRWADPDHLYMLRDASIYRLVRADGAWSSSPIHLRVAPMLMDMGDGNPPQPFPPSWPVAGVLPHQDVMNDLAVHAPVAALPAVDPRWSFYVATDHPLEPVWWFDGTGVWHPTRLGSTVPADPPIGAPGIPPGGVRARAYSVVVDPDDPRVVFVGTTVGVWRGELTLTPVGATSIPSWVWAPYCSGLPEAAVQDLAFGKWPRPGGGHLKLLRAALQARGVWEVEPDAVTPPATYLRVHPYDTRRSSPTDLRDPLRDPQTPERNWVLDWADLRNGDYRNAEGLPCPAPDGTPAGEYPWHGSPDIRVRPAQVTAAELADGPVVPLPDDLPWSGAPVDRFWLWSVQTALHTIDPLIVPDGQWTSAWEARLLAAYTTLNLVPPPDKALVTDAVWNKVQAGFWAPPWADGGPTEADLIERVVGHATPRGELEMLRWLGPAMPATSPATLGVLRRRCLVDVCLHHRGRQPLDPATVAVTLLRTKLPAVPTGWAALAPPALPTGGALDTMRQAFDALPAAGGALPPGLVLPAGWTAADTGAGGLQVRRPTRPLATAEPVVVTFEVDFSAAGADPHWLLLALVHSAADPLALTAGDLRTIVLASRHAAARSVHIV